MDKEKSGWTKKKVKDAFQRESEILKQAIYRTQNKLNAFETEYGSLDRNALYGKIDDMELLEWEGELETLERLQKNWNGYRKNGNPSTK